MPSVRDFLDDVDDYGFSRFSDKRKLRALNKVYTRIVTKQLWPFLEIVATSVAVTNGVWAVPRDMRSIITVVNRADTIKLIEETPEEFVYRTAEMGTEEQAATANATSTRYFRVEGSLPNATVTNWPADSDPVHVQYYKTHQPLITTSPEDDIILPIAWHHVLTSGHLWEMFLLVQKSEEALLWRSTFEEDLREMEQSVFQATPGNVLANPLLEDN